MTGLLALIIAFFVALSGAFASFFTGLGGL